MESSSGEDAIRNLRRLIVVFKSDHQEDVQCSEREYRTEGAVTAADKKRE